MVLIRCLEEPEGTGMEDLEVVGRESDETEKLQLSGPRNSFWLMLVLCLVSLMGLRVATPLFVCLVQV